MRIILSIIMAALALLSSPSSRLQAASARDKTGGDNSKPATADNYLDQFVDRSVSPRDDFFHFAVGKWLKAHPIPPSEKSWNAADLGGITLAWDAFTRTDQYKSGKSLGGFTPAQRYFIGWALGWMSQIRPENIAVRVKTDVHAPNFLRVTGPVSNMVPFYDAFGVKPGDKMYRADDVRVKIL